MPDPDPKPAELALAWWEYIGEELAIFWESPYGHGKEKIASFWWPLHPVESTTEVETAFERIAARLSTPHSVERIAELEQQLADASKPPEDLAWEAVVAAAYSADPDILALARKTIAAPSKWSLLSGNVPSPDEHRLAEAVIALSAALDATQHYISTACYHELHDKCRKVCKFGKEACRCKCHATQIPTLNPGISG